MNAANDIGSILILFLDSDCIFNFIASKAGSPKSAAASLKRPCIFSGFNFSVTLVFSPKFCTCQNEKTCTSSIYFKIYIHVKECSHALNINIDFTHSGFGNILSYLQSFQLSK